MIISRSSDRRKTNPARRACLLAVAVLLVAALCFPVAAREVKVAIHELKPSLFTDDQGKPDGIFVDLIEEIAAQEGWNIVWVHGTFQENLDRLAKGEIDLVIAITDTPERQKVYDFNRESAVATWAQVYAVPGKEINTILDLDGKRVAVLKGDINAIVMRDTAKKFNINPTYVERDTLNELFAETAAGNADAVVASRVAGQESAKKYGLSTTPVMFYPNSLGFAVPKGKNADLLLAIDRYLAKEKGDPSSHYSQTMQKWFGEQAGWVVPPWFWGGIAGILALAGLFVVMSVILRRQVHRKTAELADEMSKRKILIDQSRDGIVILDQQAECTRQTSVSPRCSGTHRMKLCSCISGTGTPCSIRSRYRR
jgi:ABC-type amino acid transport substrate-binding protein